ncbi:MAG: HAMP domain-containing protein, partial [Candidatus Competibacteraceae bacterium]|nr:HAMP domain-containing protein [Candidatus Competibacteraceae bacterium]
MKIEISFLRSKVARRIFLLFILSSLLPVLLLAFLSIRQVDIFTTNQQHEYLKEISKNYGLSLLDRLLFLKTKINWIAQILAQEDLPINLKTIRGFKSIKIININDKKNIISTLSNYEKLLTIIKTEINHLRSGNDIIITDYAPHLSSRIFLFQLVDKNYPEKGILIGEIDQSYLWGDIDSFGLETNLCVLDELNRALFCSHGEYKIASKNLIKINKFSSGNFTWYDSNNEELILNYWSIFLEPNFAIKKWTIITNNLKYNILLPISGFKNIFALVMLLAIAIVAFFSIHYIRKNLIPIEKIMDGIKYISNKNYNYTVEVNSGDEFEDLAHSFNRMAAQIDKQFHTLSTMSDIDQLILSNLKIEDIIRIVLSRMHEIVSFDFISITIIDHNNHSSCRTYVKNDLFREKITTNELKITLTAYQELIKNKYI